MRNDQTRCRVVPYQLDDDYFICDDEAWLPDEIEPYVTVCRICEMRFVRLSFAGLPMRNTVRGIYCSDDCRAEAKRRRSRERVWPSSQRRKAA